MTAQPDFRAPPQIRQRGTQRVPFAEFEPLLKRIRSHFNCSQHDAMRVIGYNGSSVYMSWSMHGAPVTAVNAAKGVLADLGMPELPMPPPPAPIFGFKELVDLFIFLQGYEIPKERHRELMKKIAAQMADQ